MIFFLLQIQFKYTSSCKKKKERKIFNFRYLIMKFSQSSFKKRAKKLNIIKKLISYFNNDNDKPNYRTG